MVKEYVGKESNIEWQDKYVEVYKWVEEQYVAYGVLDVFFIFDKIWLMCSFCF